MAERKRPSTTSDENLETQTKKIKLIQTTLPNGGTSTKPLCKYGAKCYRKHPDHLKAFRHPSPEEDEQVEDVDHSPSKPSPVQKPTTTNSTVSLMELTELDGDKLLRQLYQMDFPKDLAEFWKFCSNLNTKNPRGKQRMDRQANRLSCSRGIAKLVEFGIGRPL